MSEGSVLVAGEELVPPTLPIRRIGDICMLAGGV